MALADGRLRFGEPVSAFEMMTPDGQAMGWIYSDTIRVRGFDQEVIVVHGTLAGQGNLMNTTPTPLLFYAYRDGQLVDVTAELNPDRVSTVITRDIHIADFNGDGWDDIFLSNHGTESIEPFPGEQNSLLLQSETGAFVDATWKLPSRTDFSHGSSVGDFNNNGHLDIYVNNLGDDDLTPSYFLFNDGQGGFFDPVALNEAVQAEFNDRGLGTGVLSLAVDIGNNGRDDVFLGNLNYFGGGDAHGYLQNQGGSFNVMLDENFVWPGTSGGISSYQTLDFNGDGLEDIMIFATSDDIFGELGQTFGGRLIIHAYENQGEEGFRFANEQVVNLNNIEALLFQGGLDVQVVDLTGNGLPDFEVRTWDNQWDHIRLTFENDGKGGFHHPIINHDGIAIPRGHYVDLNGDGVIDLVYQGFQGIEVRYGMMQEREPGLPKQLVEDMALLYQAALDRQPDTIGLNYFVGDLRAGQSLQEIANSFYLADEFRSKFTEFDDKRYIDQLYLNVLGREADLSGLDYWLMDIEERGRSHADVLVSFAQSDENRGNAADWLAGLSFDQANDSWLL